MDVSVANKFVIQIPLLLLNLKGLSKKTENPREEKCEPFPKQTNIYPIFNSFEWEENYCLYKRI